MSDPTPRSLGEPMRATQFDYLLNAFEIASQSPTPAVHGYAEKRKALFAYVRGLESSAPARSVSSGATPRFEDMREAIFNDAREIHAAAADADPEMRADWTVAVARAAFHIGQRSRSVREEPSGIDERAAAVIRAQTRFASAVRRAFNKRNDGSMLAVGIGEAIEELNRANAALPPLDEPKLVQSTSCLPLTERPEAASRSVVGETTPAPTLDEADLGSLRYLVEKYGVAQLEARIIQSSTSAPAGVHLTCVCCVGEGCDACEGSGNDGVRLARVIAAKAEGDSGQTRSDLVIASKLLRELLRASSSTGAPSDE